MFLFMNDDQYEMNSIAKLHFTSPAVRVCTPASGCVRAWIVIVGSRLHTWI